MSFLSSVTQSPLLVRVVPFVIFVVLTSLQGTFGPASKYWIYFLKTLVGAGLIYWIWPYVKEMRWAFSWEAVVAGVAVFLIWVRLDPYYSDLDELTRSGFFKKFGLGSSDSGPEKVPEQWNPFKFFGESAGLAWFFVIVRIVGMSVVVPPLEEVFYRSFLYRYISHPDFMKIPIGEFSLKAFLISCLVFGIAHNEWLAGILCAAIYQGLVCRKKRLGDAITAHLITNLLLGCYVVWKGAYKFW
jgi:uncharacterized protein